LFYYLGGNSLEIAITFLVLLILFSVVIFLQVKLSGHANRYLGLILPFLFLAVSIFGVINNIKPDTNSKGQEYTIVTTPDGRQVRELLETVNPKPDVSGAYIVLSLLLNIPTIALVIMYIIIRKNNVIYEAEGQDDE
jgi:hypothetical protein